MDRETLENIATEFIKFLDPKAKVEVQEKDGWIIKIDSEDAGLLIGRDGETLGAMQYLLRNMIAKTADEFIPLTVDVGEYKEKKLKELEEFALAVAENVKNSGYAQELRPMSSYERRVIHSILGEFKGVKTVSIGEGELRRVKVEPGGNS